MNCGFGELKGMETGSSYRNWAMASFKTESIPRPSYRVNLIDGGANLENSATNTYTVYWNYHIRYVHGGGMSMYVTESDGDTAPRSMVTNVLFLDGHVARIQTNDPMNPYRQDPFKPWEENTFPTN